MSLFGFREQTFSNTINVPIQIIARDVRDLCYGVENSKIRQNLNLMKPYKWVSHLQGKMNINAERPQSEFMATSDEVYVIGDLHGDLTVLLAILTALGIIDQDYKLVNKKAKVFCLGDQLDGGRQYHQLPDRADPERTIQDFSYPNEEIWLLQIIEYYAIHGLIGNHELMRIEKEVGYCSPTQVCDWDKHWPNVLRWYLATRFPAAIAVKHEGGHVKLLMHTFPGMKGSSLKQFLQSLEGRLQEQNLMEYLNNAAFSYCLKGHTDSYKTFYEALWGRDVVAGKGCDGVDDFVKKCGLDPGQTIAMIGHSITKYNENNNKCQEKQKTKVYSADKGMSKAFLQVPAIQRSVHYGGVVNGQTPHERKWAAELDKQDRHLICFRLSKQTAEPIYITNQSVAEEKPVDNMQRLTI